MSGIKRPTSTVVLSPGSSEVSPVVVVAVVVGVEVGKDVVGGVEVVGGVVLVDAVEAEVMLVAVAMSVGLSVIWLVEVEVRVDSVLRCIGVLLSAGVLSDVLLPALVGTGSETLLDAVCANTVDAVLTLEAGIDVDSGQGALSAM
jgi:hypothetical protein